MGTGIWSMHYTGMLAYQLSVPVYYHIPTVILSLAAAICASFVALFVVSRPHVGFLHVVAGSSLMATGIAGMHYTEWLPCGCLPCTTGTRHSLSYQW